MPAFTSMVLTDRATTPVAHTFVPNGKSGGENPFYAVAEMLSVEAARPSVSFQTRRASGKRKTRIVFRVPVVQTETINGIATPKIVREFTIDATVSSSSTSTEEERNNAIGMFQDMFRTANTMVHDTIVKATDIY